MASWFCAKRSSIVFDLTLRTSSVDTPSILTSWSHCFPTKAPAAPERPPPRAPATPPVPAPVPAAAVFLPGSLLFIQFFALRKRPNFAAPSSSSIAWPSSPMLPLTLGCISKEKPGSNSSSACSTDSSPNLSIKSAKTSKKFFIMPSISGLIILKSPQFYLINSYLNLKGQQKAFFL